MALHAVCLLRSQVQERQWRQTLKEHDTVFNSPEHSSINTRGGEPPFLSVTLKANSCSSSEGRGHVLYYGNNARRRTTLVSKAMCVANIADVKSWHPEPLLLAPHLIWFWMFSSDNSPHVSRFFFQEGFCFFGGFWVEKCIFNLLRHLQHYRWM